MYLEYCSLYEQLLPNPHSGSQPVGDGVSTTVTPTDMHGLKYNFQGGGKVGELFSMVFVLFFCCNFVKKTLNSVNL